MENMNDDIDVIDHKPLAFGISLGTAGLFPYGFPGQFPDIAADRLEMRAYLEQVSDMVRAFGTIVELDLIEIVKVGANQKNSNGSASSLKSSPSRP